MTVHQRRPVAHRPGTRSAPAGDRPSVTVAMAWIDGAGAVRRDVRTCADAPGLDAATAVFARGTVLRTPDGPVAVEDLGPGDRVATQDGWRRIAWTAARSLRGDGARPLLMRVAAWAFGAGPAAPVLLGVQALVLLDDPRCAPLVGRRTALAPLCAFADGLAVARVAPEGAVPVHGLAFGGEGTVCVGGLAVAAAHPAHPVDRTLHARLPSDLAALFPQLADGPGFGLARMPCLTTAEARRMAETGAARAAPCARPW